MASQVIDDDQSQGSTQQYYQDGYEHIRPSIPETQAGKFVAAIMFIGAAALTLQALLPAGTAPNSIEPWVGPLPFSFAWLFFWAIVLELGLVFGYLTLTTE